MAKHRRHGGGVLLVVQQYEQLLVLLHGHRPGLRSGTCLVCGTAWPCADIRLLVTQKPPIEE